MGSPPRREPHGDGVAVVAAGVTTCRGAEESSVQDEGRQGNRLNLIRRREMRRGQRERSGNWRAGCLETSMSGVRREARCDIPAASRRNWEEVPGLSVYLDVKTEGDKSRLRKRSMLESVVEQGYRTTRSLWVELDCPNSNPDVMFMLIHRKNACNRCHALFWHEPWAGRLP